MLVLKNTVKCKWLVRNKKGIFSRLGEKKKITFSYPSSVCSISHTNLGEKILKIVSRGSINKKTSYAYIKTYNQGLFCS